MMPGAGVAHTRHVQQECDTQAERDDGAPLGEVSWYTRALVQIGLTTYPALIPARCRGNNEPTRTRHPPKRGHRRDLRLPGAVTALHVNIVPVPERTKDLALLTPQLNTEDLLREQNRIVQNASSSVRLIEAPRKGSSRRRLERLLKFFIEVFSPFLRNEIKSHLHELR